MTISAAMTSSMLYENGITDVLKAGRRGPTLAMPAMLCSLAAAMVAKEKGRRRFPPKRWRPRKGKGGRRGRQVRGGKGTNKDGGVSAAAAGGDGSSAKAADGGTSEVRCQVWQEGPLEDRLHGGAMQQMPRTGARS